MKKRIISGILAVCMLSCTLLASAAKFTDVKTSDWFYDAVEYTSSHNLMGGTSATTFSPSTITSRGMIVTILHRMAGNPTGEGATFTDVAANAYYAAPIAWASGKSGIANGYGNNRFGPNDSITREQMAVFLYNYAKYCGKSFATAPTDISSFADASTVSSWAVEAMRWACGAKLIGGSNNRLDPRGKTTRAQAATMIMRYVQTFGMSSGINITEGTFRVGFNKNYGTPSLIPSVQVFEGEKATPPADPTRAGYTFAGWYTEPEGGKKFDFSTIITESITLYAHWTKA